MSFKKKGIALAVWWGWMPLLYVAFWGVLHYLMEGFRFGQQLDQFMLANFWSGSVMFWTWLAIGLIGTVVILMYDEQTTESGSSFNRRVSTERTLANGPVRIVAVIVTLLAIVSVVQVFRVSWDNDKDEARYYNRATTFYVPDISDAPNSIQRLTGGATQSTGEECDLVGSADVPSCIREGTLDMAGWDPRVGSLSGATYALARSTGDRQKVSLNEDTMAYLNGESPRWSGILDGSGSQQALGGVAEWEGEGEASQCLFEGEFATGEAFGGNRRNSLNNLLAERFPALRFSISDVWGYCDGDEPIVVVPMTRQVRTASRTVDTAGGLVTVRGDNGQTQLTYIASAEPGDFPGPVYPASMVVEQRNQMEWAAGRKSKESYGFGYEPATSEVQEGNVSEYLLRNATTGRLEWVTPLTLHNSSSELFVAYAVSPADEVSSGDLNRLDVYVLADDDPRRVNIDNLEADALNYFVENVGTFRSNGGKLVEFVPVDGDIWRAFGELNGRVVYRLDISANNSISPRLVSLSPEDPSESVDNAACGEPVSGLTPAQLVGCIQQMADELEAREQASGN